MTKELLSYRDDGKPFDIKATNGKLSESHRYRDVADASHPANQASMQKSRLVTGFRSTTPKALHRSISAPMRRNGLFCGYKIE
jgi:hypothetical protein